MTEITPSRNIIQIEETRFRAAVSEATAQRLGGSMNLILEREYQEKTFYVNGKYGTLTIPFTGIDGLELFLFDSTIINAFFFIKTAGTSGSTTLDIQYATTPGGSFTSIFSTKPSISYLAGDYAWCYVGSAFPNTTAPVLSTDEMDAGWVIRCNIDAVQGGDAVGCGLVLQYQPR